MAFINPWTYYQIHEPENIPDLNPHNNEESVGCFVSICGFIISSIIFVLTTYLLFSITVNGCINRYWFPVLMLANCVVIYPILIILLMKLSFKITEKITIKNKKK